MFLIQLVLSTRKNPLHGAVAKGQGCGNRRCTGSEAVEQVLERSQNHRKIIGINGSLDVFERQSYEETTFFPVKKSGKTNPMNGDQP